LDSATYELKLDSSVVVADFAVLMDLPDVLEFVNDTENNEFRWYFKTGDEIEYSYGLNYGKEPPAVTMQKVAAMIELNTRWIAEQAEKQAALERRISALENGKIEGKTSVLLKIIVVFLGICIGLLTYFAFTKQNFITHE